MVQPSAKVHYMRASGGSAEPGRLQRQRLSHTATMLVLLVAFGGIGADLMRHGLVAQPTIALAAAAPVATSFSRPDIIDRNGRLLATDLEAPSLYVDPALVIDRDEVVEKLLTVLPDLNAKDVRKTLADKSRRFAWIRRAVSPGIAQKIHDLGLPGVSFRGELTRAYPAGALAEHVLGAVNVDNRGVSGIEKYIDDNIGVDPVHAATLSSRTPVRLTLDVGVQHALEDELDTAMRRYKTSGAAGVVLDVATGEVIASSSLPRLAKANNATPNTQTLDKIQASTFELGSVFKTISIAMALDEGIATPQSIVDVTEPLIAGRYTITDFHPAGRPLSVAEIFTHSSNVGTGMMALKAGPDRMRGFLGKLGLLTPMLTEAGAVAAPQIPRTIGRAELITISYGHGLAVAPLQFATAAASLFNGGQRIWPSYIKGQGALSRSDVERNAPSSHLITQETGRQMARLFRLNVMGADGTGSRAEVPGYRVGGKTGTADLAESGGYKSKAVISSFLAAFPMDNPRYLTFVLLFEPQGTDETGGQRTASLNAAPVTGRLIARIAPQLGVAPLVVSQTQ